MLSLSAHKNRKRKREQTVRKSNELNNLIYKYRKDATNELWKNYLTLTNSLKRPKPNDLRFQDNCLHDNEHVYIDMGNVGRIPDYSTPNGKLYAYPVDNYDLWPWSVLNRSVSSMTSDVMQLLCQYLVPRDIEACSRVNKQWYHSFKARERPILQRFCDYVHNQTGMSVDPPTLKSLSRLKMPTYYDDLKPKHFLKADPWLQELVIRSGFKRIINSKRMTNFILEISTHIRDEDLFFPDRFCVSVDFISTKTNQPMHIVMFSKYRHQKWNVRFCGLRFTRMCSFKDLFACIETFWDFGDFNTDFLESWENYQIHTSSLSV